MEGPRVTVLMTYYNKGPFVVEAVNSVLSSTFTDLELLIVDDASTDGGLEAVRAIGDPRIRILHNPVNLGRAGAANRGYDEARGEYIAVLDADDTMHPTRLEKQATYLDAHRGIGALGTYAQRIGSWEEVAKWPLTDRASKGRMLMGDPILYGTAMFRRAVLDANGVRCKTHWRHPGMDYLFLLDVARATDFAGLPETLTFYRMGDQNFRHGRDPVEDRAVLYREVLRGFGIPFTEEDIDRQLMLHKLFRTPPTAEHVRGLHAWMQRLQRISQERGLFDAEVFAAELDRRWKSLFFALADHNTGAAMAHLRLSGGFAPARWRYLATVALRRGLTNKAQA